MNIAYFDITFGASGDMMLASFVDLGLPEERLVSLIKELNLPDDIRIVSDKVIKNGISAVKLDVKRPDEKSHSRDFADIKKLISSSQLKSDVKDKSIKIFTALAYAEAKVHGIAPDDVRFHEVGAIDSIVDIVSIAYAFNFFRIKSAFHSAIPLVSGIVDAAHGKLPAMSPAASILLKGRRFYRLNATGEIITPTAAAVISTLATCENVPDFSYESIGTGAGSRDFKTHPNIMRIFLGKTGSSGNLVTMIETNIDDMSPELFKALFEALFECEGVLDVCVVPVTMKKSRPAFILKALVKKASFDVAADIIFTNSTTIGLRYYDVNRITLDRNIDNISTKFGDFSVKISRLKGKIMNASCEYDECKKAAKKLNLSVKEVLNYVNSEIQRKYFNDR